MQDENKETSFPENQNSISEEDEIIRNDEKKAQDGEEELAADNTADEGQKKSAISSDLIRGHINTIILRSLYQGDRYGYDIINEIEQKSHGQYTLKQPTLYSALKRLESQGYVKSYWGGVSNGGRRRYFSLTDEGRKIAEKNQAEWEYSRTIIDSLISENDFDFSNPAPEKLDFRILRQATSRTPIVSDAQENALASTFSQNSPRPSFAELAAQHLAAQSAEDVSTQTPTPSIEIPRERSIRDMDLSLESAYTSEGMLLPEDERSPLHQPRRTMAWKQGVAVETGFPLAFPFDEERSIRDSDMTLDSAYGNENTFVPVDFHTMRSTNQPLYFSETAENYVQYQNPVQEFEPTATQQPYFEEAAPYPQQPQRAQPYFEEAAPYPQQPQPVQPYFEEATPYPQQPQPAQPYFEEAAPLQNNFDALQPTIQPQTTESQMNPINQQNTSAEENESEPLPLFISRTDEEKNYKDIVTKIYRSGIKESQPYNSISRQESDRPSFDETTNDFSENESYESWSNQQPSANQEEESSYTQSFETPQTADDYTVTTSPINDTSETINAEKFDKIANDAPVIPKNIDFDEIQDQAAFDGLRLWTTNGKPMKTKMPATFFNKGVALLKAGLVFLIFSLTETAIATIFKTEWQLDYAYLGVMAGIAVLPLLISAVLYFAKYQPFCKKSTHSHAVQNGVAAFIATILLLVAVDFMLNINLTEQAVLIKYVAIPVVYLFNIIVFSIAYYCLSKNKAKK